jgi:hypothetical protein
MPILISRRPLPPIHEDSVSRVEGSTNVIALRVDLYSCIFIQTERHFG